MTRHAFMICALCVALAGCYRADGLEHHDSGADGDAGATDAGVPDSSALDPVDSGAPWVAPACMAPPRCRWRTRDDGSCDDPVAVASSPWVGCVVLASGTVECWGLDVSGGLLGRGDVGEDWSPTPVPGVTTAIDLAIDLGHACALLRDGRVTCWGGLLVPDAPPTVVDGVAGAVEVAVGRDFGCARLASGQVSCWGRPTAALGRGYSPTEPAPGASEALGDVERIWAGGNSACARSASRGVLCWGSGQVVGGPVMEFEPIERPALSDAIDVALDYNNFCFVRSSGQVVCAGFNNEGQLGDGTLEPRDALVQVTGVTDARAVVAPGYPCARLGSGRISCWPARRSGVAGVGSMPSLLPAELPFIEDSELFGVALSWSATRGLMWFGRAPSRTSARIELGQPARAIAARARHYCAVLADRTSRCWGRAWRLPDAPDDEVEWYDRPTVISGAEDASSVAVGSRFACVSRGGAVACWGAVPGTASTESAIEIDGVSGAAGMALGRTHACVLDTEGGVRCWGDNSRGQLGLLGAPSTTGPRVVPGIPPLERIAASDFVTCGHTADSTAWCWGARAPELSEPSVDDVVVPRRVPELDGTALHAAPRAMCAVRDGDRLVCLGLVGERADEEGWPGHAVATEVAHVRDAESWAVARHACAMAADRVACVGASGDAQLGGAPVSGEPVAAFPSCSTAIAAGDRATCAIDARGEVWCWGSDASHFTAPVVIHPEILD